jgi:hypothetical protein
MLVVHSAFKSLIKKRPRYATVSIMVGDFEESHFVIVEYRKLFRFLLRVFTNSALSKDMEHLVIYVRQDDLEEYILDHAELTRIANIYSVVPYDVNEVTIPPHFSSLGSISYSKVYILTKVDILASDIESDSTHVGFNQQIPVFNS